MIERQTMTVTPALAAEWLAKNRRNMPVRKDRVARIAAELTTQGKFHSDIPIALYTDGTIADGHTRLAAIQMSGIAVECTVEKGYVTPAGGTVADGAGQRSAHGRS